MKTYFCLFVICMCSYCAADVTVLNHPLLLHKLTIMRDKKTSCNEFQRVLREVGQGVAYEITRDLPLVSKEIETPLKKMQAPVIAGKKLCLVSIMRAGNGFLEGFRDFMPSTRVAHIGCYRAPVTCEPVKYYEKFPRDMHLRDAIIVDPMLGTAGTATTAIETVKQQKPRSITCVFLLAAPEGIKRIQEEYPDVSIYVVAIDECLNEKKYLVPGLGDAGDRIYGTR